MECQLVKIANLNLVLGEKLGKVMEGWLLIP